MARRPPPAAPSLKRAAASQTPRVELVIACEGKKTEPTYLEACANFYGLGSVRLRILRETGVPLTLVKLAVAERQELLDRYRRSRDSFDHCFRVWAVFDRDEHPHFQEAIELANQHQISLAISNPCFELWPLLHFQDQYAHLDRAAVQRLLSERMTSYDHEKNPIVDFPTIADKVSDAIDRAERMANGNVDVVEPFANPSTSMYTLVQRMIENGRKQPRPRT